VSPVTKLTYLRELLDDRVRKTIEALPNSPEGYNRAKEILEERFGKESEIVKAYLKEIIDLPHTPTANPRKILEFFEKLSYNVQALESLNRLSHVNGMVSLTLEKLPTIRGDLVRNDPEWEQWDFIKLTNALRPWTRRNPVDDFKPEPETFKKQEKPQHAFQTQQRKSHLRRCVYCDGNNHRSSECPSVSSTEERKKFLITEKLCFNCTGPHKSSESWSVTNCQNCKKRHHTSICETPPRSYNPDRVLTTPDPVNKEVTYPIFLVELDNIKTHALQVPTHQQN